MCLSESIILLLLKRVILLFYITVPVYILCARVGLVEPIK